MPWWELSRRGGVDSVEFVVSTVEDSSNVDMNEISTELLMQFSQSPLVSSCTLDDSCNFVVFL